MEWLSMSGGSLSIGTFGDGFIVIGAGGRDSPRSSCGSDFDAYVRRAIEEPFPWDPYRPVGRQVTNLWNGRRARLYLDGKWREGRVQSWTQSNSGPFGSFTFWEVTVEFESIETGDIIELQGLCKTRSAKKDNGKRGEILEYRENEESYKVKLLEGCTSSKVKPRLLVVKAENIKDRPFLELQVHRMNIEGGGTLKLDSKDELVSLEWLEPASPTINLLHPDNVVTCPFCRAEQAPEQPDDSPMKEDHECPICFETKECRILPCNHIACDDCWTKIVAGPNRLPDMDAEVLQHERARRTRELAQVAPHRSDIPGALATTPEDSEDTIEEACNNFEKFLNDKLLAITENVRNNEDLEQFKTEMMVDPIALLMIGAYFETLNDKLTINALEVLLNVVEKRKDEACELIRTQAIPTPGHAWSDGMCTQKFASLCLTLCNSIGELYEHSEMYHDSIPWYERAVVYAKTMVDAVANDVSKESLSTQYNNLGLAQRRAGLFTSALESYNAGMNIADTGNVSSNKAKLLEEMTEWTGNSGNLTPGC